MTRETRPNCAIRCNLISTYTHPHPHTPTPTNVGKKHGKIHLKLAEYERASWHMSDEESLRPQAP